MKFFRLSCCIFFLCIYAFAGAQQNGSLFLSSLSHDIMTAHVRVLRVKNEVGAGTGFTILLSVEDNGSGSPQKALAKIFQPFFTTTPTGQGTGLGLSLSYDIVKAHGEK